MNKVFESIARENFRTSGYLTHPRREGRTVWTFTSAPRSPFQSTNAVHDALQRRERARLKAESQPSLFKHWIDALLHR